MKILYLITLTLFNLCIVSVSSYADAKPIKGRSPEISEARKMVKKAFPEWEFATNEDIDNVYKELMGKPLLKSGFDGVWTEGDYDTDGHLDFAFLGRQKSPYFISLAVVLSSLRRVDILTGTSFAITAKKGENINVSGYSKRSQQLPRDGLVFIRGGYGYVIYDNTTDQWCNFPGNETIKVERSLYGEN